MEKEPQPMVEMHPLRVTLSAARIRDAALRVWAWLARHDWVLVLAGYSALTLAITFPLIFHLSDSIMGTDASGDDLWYVWYSWWVHQALLMGQDPAFTHLLYALTPRTEIFAASTDNGVLGALLIFVLSPVATYNILMLLGFALSGLAMYLLAHEFVRSRLACFVAGFLYTFTTDHFWRAEGHLDLATLEWLPFLVWRVFVFYRRPSRWNAVLMGIAIAMMPLNDFYLSAYFLVPFALLFVIWLLITDRGWLRNREHFLLTGLAFVVTTALALPPLYSSLFNVDPALQEAINVSSSPASTISYSSDIITYLFPHPFNPIFGSEMYGSIRQAAYPPGIEAANFLGWTTMLLAGGALLFRHNRSSVTYLWVALAFFGFIISLGPSIHFAGHTGAGLPNPLYDAIYRLPILANFRSPNRAGPTVTLPLTLLSAYTLGSLFERFGRVDLQSRPIAGVRASRVLIVGLSVLIMAASLAEHIQFALPFPITSVQVPAIYYQMATDPTSGLVLTLPVYPRGSDEYNEIIDHRALVNGYANRLSLPMIRSIENVPYLSFFDPSAGSIASDPNVPNLLKVGDIYPIHVSFKQGLEESGIRYVVFDVPLKAQIPNYPVLDTQYPTIVKPWMLPFLMQQLGAPIYDSASEGVIAWRLTPTPLVSSVYHFTMGDGWLPGISATVGGGLVRYLRQDGLIDIEAPSAGSVHLTMTAFSQVGARTMLVTLNGKMIQTHRFSQSHQGTTLDLGQVALHAGPNTLEVHSVESCPGYSKADPEYSDLRCLGVTQVAMPSA